MKQEIFYQKAPPLSDGYQSETWAVDKEIGLHSLYVVS